MWHQTGGLWSAPLDDVFIHLDFARQTARGAWLEWAPGNGYSSGATSPLYALVLAAGYLLGARGSSLLVVAALLAMAACWAALLGYRRGYVALGRHGTAALLVLPLLFYCVGAVDWAFWSGMEVALFVGLHGVVFAAWCRHAARGVAPRALAAWGFGALCILLVATRPEALLTVLWFALGLAICTRGHRVRTLVATSVPSAAFVYALSLVNRWQTGDATAYGALVKLAWYNPTLSLADKWQDYKENLEHVVRAVFQTHVGSVPHACSVLFALAVLAFGDRARLRATLLLWVQWVSWFLLVSLNGQVRWQNERYAMPAVAWLLVLAAFGVAGARRAPRGAWLAAGAAGLGSFFASALGDVFERRARWPYPFDLDEPSSCAKGALQSASLVLREAPVVWYWTGGFVLLTLFAWRHRVGRGLALGVAALVLADATEPNIRTQRWFFGRASKNILEQQTKLGAWLRDTGGARRGRVLVGDAGAILYASDWKGLDLIGLGGYHDLPFARAGALGLGAQLELLERLPEADRPELLAIFPSWWESLPLFFTSEVVKRFPIQGNVICGDFEHVLYRADWSLLRSGARPRMLPRDLRVLDVLDTGDLVSERSHRYEYGPTRKNGKVTFKILRDASGLDTEADDMLDAGRRLGMGSFERFVLRGAAPNQRAYVLVRTAPEGLQEFRLTVRGQGMETRTLPIRLEETGSFVETPFVIEPPIAKEVEVEVEALGPGDYVDYHVYFAQ